MNDTQAQRPLARKKIQRRKNIHERNGKFSVVLREKETPTSKSKPVWHPPFETLAEAEKFRDDRKRELREGRALAKSRMTVGQFMKMWLSHHAMNKPLSKSTQVTYEGKIRNYIIPILGEKPIQSIKPIDLKNWVGHLMTSGGRDGSGLAAATVRYAGAILKEAFVAAVEEYELLTINPAANLKLPQSPKSGGDVWTVQETKKFMEAVAEDQLYSLFVFLFATGARRGEVLALLWDDIDLDKGTVSINKAAQWVKGQRLIGPTKTGANRSIPIDPPTIKTLKSHRAKQAGEKIGSVHWQENNLVFCHSDGSPLRPDYPYGVFKRYSQRAGVRPIRLHDIRHTHATWLLEAGEQLHVVSERLGHADTSTTARIYAHVTVRQRQEAADTFSRLMEEG